MQEGDVKLFQTNDGGDIIIENGIAEMSGGLETSAYLSLFGGNEDDDGREGNPYTWWGNIEELVEEKKYRSETGYLLQSLPITTDNLRRIEDAASRDLAWFVESKIASSVTVFASISSVNMIKLNISIKAIGKEEDFEFVENWRTL